MKTIKLTPRLLAVASQVKPCDVVADIGTDHGFVPTYLVQKNVCTRAIASDINKEPLKSAMRTAASHNITDKLEFICAPGLEGIIPGSVDTVVIAGMGGETIVEILKAAEWVKEHGTMLVLQPQSKLELFEDYLNSNGFSINGVRLVKDAGRIYTIFDVQYSGKLIDSNITYFCEYLKKDPLFLEYADGLLKKLELRKAGLQSANNTNVEELENICNTVEYIKSVVLEVKANGNS